MTYEFKAGETYQTRDGRDARIYATDGEESSPIHGAIKLMAGLGWMPFEWKADGRASRMPEKNRDLLPPKRQAWVAVWLEPGNGHPQTHAFFSKSSAEDCMNWESRTRIAVLGPIDVEAEP